MRWSIHAIMKMASLEELQALKNDKADYNACCKIWKIS